MRDLAAPIDSLDYSASCRQVHQLVGDCYDFVPLPDQRLSFTIGDASGKGLAAALMISNVQSSIRTAALFAGKEVAAVLRAVNRQVYASSPADRYATLFYGVVDPDAHTLRYVNAGHNPPMVIRGDGSIVWLEAGGAPVGMFPNWSYEQGSVQLNSGDLVLAHTDGVIEAVNAFGEEWGIEGLRKAAVRARGRSAADTVDAIFAAMDEFSRGVQNDDATIAALRLR
jgi:sigma-B regulation protein RsbU (phosphoserine phosphatase)